MPLCVPYKAWRGIKWEPVQGYENENFVLQGNKWWKEWRILIHSTKTRYCIASARSRETIQQDWETIIQEYDEEVKRVRSKAFSEYHLLKFFEELAATDLPGEQKKIGFTTSQINFQNDEKGIENDRKKLWMLLNDSQTTKNEINEAIKSIKDLNELKDEKGGNSLHVLCLKSSESKNDIELAKILISHGIDVNCKDMDGWTPLHSACYFGNLSLASLLLKSDSKVLVVTVDGTVALSYLVRHSFDNPEYEQTQLRLVQEMLDGGVSVNSQNNNGDAPLHLATKTGGLKIIELLISKGANVNIVNKISNTPLHFAARRGRKDICELLVNNGADLSSQDLHSDIPLDIARACHHNELCAFLKPQMPDPNNPSPPTSDDVQPENNNNFKTTVKIETAKKTAKGFSALSSISSDPDILEINQLTQQTIQQSQKKISNSNQKHIEDAKIPTSSPLKHTQTHRKSFKPIEQKVTHSFQLKSFSKPSWCQYCLGYIWSPIQNGYACEVCGYVIHSHCKKQALFYSPCKKERVEEPKFGDIFKRLSSAKMDLTEVQRHVNLLEQYNGIDEKELDALFLQFEAMDVDQDGYITENEFKEGLGANLNDEVLASALFSLMDEEKDKKIDFKEFLNGMTVLIRGVPRDQLEFAFGMFSPDTKGYVSKENFERVIQSIERSLGAIKFDSQEFINQVFNEADVKKENRITLEHYMRVVNQKRLFIQSLGLLKMETEPIKAPKLNTKKGVSITFGHSSWDLSYHMMLGIRITAAETVSQAKDFTRDFEPKDFELVVECELRSFSKSEDPWNFKHYAPIVFHRLRQLFHVVPEEYMFSLGPEKILGNLLLGSLSALCEMISTGKSGSFFFKTNDNKYLIKTLPPEEHNLLLKILPAYYEYMKSNQNSLLTRYFGLYSIKKGPGRELFFVVMYNLFQDEIMNIQEQFDLKGSTVGRSTKINLTQTGIEKAEIAFKDNDFQRLINLGNTRRAQLLEQIESDTKFLEKLQICDYSFLVGFHTIQKSEEELVQLHNKTKLEKDYAPVDSNIWREDFTGILSSDNKEIYFIGIIDHLTLWGLSKMGEHIAKSFVYDSNQISAIPPHDYRLRFQKYINSIIV